MEHRHREICGGVLHNYLAGCSDLSFSFAVALCVMESPFFFRRIIPSPDGLHFAILANPLQHTTVLQEGAEVQRENISVILVIEYGLILIDTFAIFLYRSS